MRKQIIALLLVLAMVLSVAPITGLAASDEAIQAANALYELGLFQGTGANADGTPNFDLDRTPTRHEAVTMLVRLLGKEDEAKAGTWETPFTDVDDWAKPYVGYAYTNGLTTGTSETTFGGANTIDAPQYLTFVLRALGYTSGTDFQWDKPWELSDSIGLTDGNYNADNMAFTRGDVAVISLVASSISIGSIPNVSNSASTSTKEEIAKRINRIVVNWMIAEKFFERAVDSFVSGAINDGVGYGSLIRDCFLNISNFASEAVELCGKYDDTQSIKSMMNDIQTRYAQYGSYTATNITLGGYLMTLAETAFDDSETELIGALRDVAINWGGETND